MMEITAKEVRKFVAEHREKEMTTLDVLVMVNSKLMSDEVIQSASEEGIRIKINEQMPKNRVLLVTLTEELKYRLRNVLL